MKYKKGDILQNKWDSDLKVKFIQSCEEGSCFEGEVIKDFTDNEITHFKGSIEVWPTDFYEPVEEVETITEDEAIKCFDNRKMKRVYIAMPFSYDPSEAKKLYKLTCQALAYKYGDRYLFISTIPLFDYLCKTNALIETNVIGMSYTLIDSCEELWQFGTSKGVLEEVSYAKTKGINVRVME